jgi:copper(I)-binding protein
MRTTLFLAAVVLAPLALIVAGCQTASTDVSVENAWIRLAAVPNQPAAAYFTLTGAVADDTLIAVHNDNVIKAELHESMAGMKGMDEMKPLASVLVPAKSKIVFAPGGKHVMLFSVNGAVKPGTTTPLTLVFKSGLQVAENATVVAAGDAEPFKK